jgi:hypothetical protein
MSIEKHAHRIAQYGIWPYEDALQKIESNDPFVAVLDTVYTFVTDLSTLAILPYCKARYAEEQDIAPFHEAFVFMCVDVYKNIMGDIFDLPILHLSALDLPTFFPHAEALACIPELSVADPEKSLAYIAQVVSYMEEKQQQYQKNDPFYAEWQRAILN